MPLPCRRIASKVSSGAARKLTAAGLVAFTSPSCKCLSQASHLVGPDELGQGPTEQVVYLEAQGCWARLALTRDDREVMSS